MEINKINSNIALVLPAFNLEKQIEKSLLNIKKGIEYFPEKSFILYTIDDCSNDKTAYKIQEVGDELGLTLKHHINFSNKGLVKTLFETYNRIFEDGNQDYILKTDLDSDFDQSIVLKKLIPHIEKNSKIVAGVRWREITREENEYEFDRRGEIEKIMKNSFDFIDLDPASCGSQIYDSKVLINLLKNQHIINYKRKWGLDFLIPLVARSEGIEVTIEKIEKGKYDITRRGYDKVKSQYDAYLETIGKLIGKNPTELSSYYN